MKRFKEFLFLWRGYLTVVIFLGGFLVVVSSCDLAAINRRIVERRQRVMNECIDRGGSWVVKYYSDGKPQSFFCVPKGVCVQNLERL